MCMLRYSSNPPMAAWRGTTQLLRRPTRALKRASTSGDHASLAEYGYAARANVPSCAYDRCARSRNGIEPVQRSAQ
jgi:hypothetical protein